jgi:hypothetical protein
MMMMMLYATMMPGCATLCSGFLIQLGLLRCLRWYVLRSGPERPSPCFSSLFHDVSATSLIKLSPDIHFGFGQTCEIARINSVTATCGSRSPRFCARLTLANTLPLSMAIGTGPYALESVELLALSPASQTYPLGIRTCSLSNLPLGVNTGTSLAFSSI